MAINCCYSLINIYDDAIQNQRFFLCSHIYQLGIFEMNWPQITLFSKHRWTQNKRIRCFCTHHITETKIAILRVRWKERENRNSVPRYANCWHLVSNVWLFLLHFIMLNIDSICLYKKKKKKPQKFRAKNRNISSWNVCTAYRSCWNAWEWREGAIFHLFLDICFIWMFNSVERCLCVCWINIQTIYGWRYNGRNIYKHTAYNTRFTRTRFHVYFRFCNFASQFNIDGGTFFYHHIEV